MCTAVSYKTESHYFGRNLDLFSYRNETVTVTPRRYPFRFAALGEMKSHYAMIGMASVDNGYPLYYEATNEVGLSMAGLNFPDNAVYLPHDENKDNAASFELIPWILGQCADVSEATALLERVNITDTDYSPSLPHTPLHWLAADRDAAITAEPMSDGLHLYANPVGVLTNNPPFEYQLSELQSYIGVSAQPPIDRFSDKLKLEQYSLGMGGIGLPGDHSSRSRFVRCAFTALNSVSDGSENDSVMQFFHILGSVEQQRGCTVTRDGRFEYTLYSSCCNTDTGVYYYRTYGNSRITAVDMHCEELDGKETVTYPLITDLQILRQNSR